MRFTTESEFIGRIRRLARRRRRDLILGIGDDAAIFGSSSQPHWCVTSDLLVEGIHFDLRWDSPNSVGHKSLTAGLSDIAAMGARPRFALVSLAVPKLQAERFLTEFYRGFLSLARQHKVVLIGGDTSNSMRGCFVDVIVLGQAQRPYILRSGARAGHRLFVTGHLGKAAWGLQLVKCGATPKTELERLAVKAHQYPSARTAAASWLSRNNLASAMIDVSDGLSTDLHHLCAESGVGAVIVEPRIPFQRGTPRPAMLSLALGGGEDYELLFTVPPQHLRRVRSEMKQRGLSEIGTIVPRRNGISLLSSSGKGRPIKAAGWDHFQ